MEIPPQKTIERSINILNIGSSPLIITDVNTSRGCIDVLFSKQPISPNNSTNIILRITPKETGFFNKRITINGNINKPFIVTIQGNISD